MELENKYQLYLEKRLSKDQLKEEIIKYAYYALINDKYIEAGDFILELIPNLDSIIDKYNNNLLQFDHYIKTHIKWIKHSFSKKYVKEKENVNAYSIYINSEYKLVSEVMEETQEYSITNNAKKLLSINNGIIEKESLRNRLEIFALKNSRNLTEEQILIIAPLLSRSPEWLFNKKEELEMQCVKRVENREYLKRRYNRLLMEIAKLQGQLECENNDKSRYKLLNKIDVLTLRKNELIIQISSRNCGPKNDEIAKILGIPKGTVDSSLFYIKKALESLLPDINND